MKKIVLCVIALLMIFGTVGCSKDKLYIKAEDITTDTLLARTNGELQVATVEEFDKTYYKLSELEEFVKAEVDQYNSKAGANSIKIDDIEIRDNKAFMILSYAGMKQYSTFNEMSAAYFNGGVKDILMDLPETLLTAKGGAPASTKEVLGNDKYKILVMNEPYDVIVEGTVKYYSDNAKLLENNKVQCAAEGMTIVVYK